MFIRKETYRQGIILSTIFNIVCKGLVFFNIVLIAFFFGTSRDVDIYFYSYNLILLIVTYSSSINTSVLIPEAIRIRLKEGEVPSMNFVNYFLYFYLAIVLLLIVVIYFNPALSFAAVSQYSVATLNQHINILLLVIPLLLLMTVTTFLSDVLVSYRFFTMPMIITSINAVISMVCIIAFHNKLAIMSALIGLIISYLLNVCMLLFLMRKHLNWRFRLGLRKPERRVLKNLVLTQAGTLASSLGTYAPIYFFSGWQAGVISALNYAQQIFYQPTALLTNQITIVSRIKLNELFVNRQHADINANFLSSFRFLLFLLIPISTIFVLYSFEIISVLFNRGSFDAQSARLSAMFLKYLSLTLPLIAMNNLMANLFYASQLLRTVMFYQILSNIVMAVLIYQGIIHFGEIGFPIAFLVTYVLSILLLFLICKKSFPFIRFDLGMAYFFRLSLVNCGLYFIVKGINTYIPHLDPILRMIFGSVIYCFLLIWVSYQFKLNEEFTALVQKVRDRLFA